MFIDQALEALGRERLAGHLSRRRGWGLTMKGQAAIGQK